MRRLAIALLLVAVVPAFLLHGARPQVSFDPHIRRIDLMPGLRDGGLPRGFGPFELVGAWQLTSRHRDFGNYSGLARLRNGVIVAVGDKDGLLYFTPPDRPGAWKTRIAQPNSGDSRKVLIDGDAEAISIDPRTQEMLIAYEGVPRLYRFGPDLRGKVIVPAPVLMEWPQNKGPEAMRRLADGRTVMIGEVYARTFNRRLQPSFVYPGLPRPHEAPGRFAVRMPDGYRPTELEQLPDGRLLVLGRKVTLAGFRSVIALADPRAIRAGAVMDAREVARIDDPRIADNYEGMMASAERDGSVTVWLISDSNLMVWLQRTLLLKLRLRPADMR